MIINRQKINLKKIIILILIISLFSGLAYLININWTAILEKNNDVSQNTLQQVFEVVKLRYNNKIPFENLSKESYQFFPLTILGYTLASNMIDINLDANFTPIKSFKLSNQSQTEVPVKSSYVAYYEIPEFMFSRYNLDPNSILLPIELTVIELERALSKLELEVIDDESFLNCTNNEISVSKINYSNSDVTMHFCRLNLNNEQLSQIEQSGIYDDNAVVYFKKRNLLVILKSLSKYASPNSELLEEYISNILSTNLDLAAKQKQIRSIESRREFRNLIQQKLNN